MRSLFAASLSFVLAFPSTAQDLLSEASGNWAGSSNGGFFFRAELTRNDDRVRLRIWNALDAVPAGDDLQFDNPEIALGAFATDQRLEVVETPDGSILQVVTEFADEEAEGREVLQIQYLDNQYTVIGYYHLSTGYNPGGEPISYECKVDLWNGKAAVDGSRRDLPPMDFETKNASGWRFGAAFDRGYCPQLK
jgi:hypothetical protein